MTKQELQQKKEQGYRVRYGFLWPPLSPGRPAPDWWIEKCAYIQKIGNKRINISQSTEWLGEKEHFRRFMNIIYCGEHAAKPFQWNPNAVRIFDAYFSGEKFIAAVGHKSSSKSTPLAAIGVAEFLADPANTACLFTSTSLTDSHKRIWGDVERYWNMAKQFFGEANLPGELVSSMGIIKAVINGNTDRTKGCSLIPGDKKTDGAEGIGKIKGYKASRIRFFADELSDLSEKIIEAAETNLFQDNFKMVAALNCNTKEDAGGKFCEPENGWDDPSVDVDNSDGWKSKRGVVLRFDAIKSPNVVAGEVIWDGLLTKAEYEDRLAEIGDTSNFARQFRARWPKDNQLDTLYSTAIINSGRACRAARFIGSTTDLAAADPSFEHGGDRFPLVFAKLGEADASDEDGQKTVLKTLSFEKLEYLDDGINITEDKNDQTVTRMVEQLNRREHKIRSGNLGLDVTGGGSGIVTIIGYKWGGGIHKVNFRSAASDIAVSLADRRPCNEVYANLVTEMWAIGIEFVKCGQIRNLPPVIIEQITKRTFTSDSRGKIIIETKQDFKKRIGRSPDEADAFFIVLDLARKVHGFTPSGKRAKMKREDNKMIIDGMDFSKLFSPQNTFRAKRPFILANRYANARVGKIR